MNSELKLHTIANQRYFSVKAHLASGLSERIHQLTYQHRTGTSIDRTLDYKQEEDEQEDMAGRMQYMLCIVRSSVCK